MPKLMQYTKGAIPYFEGDEDTRVFILQQGALILVSTDIETGNKVKVQVKSGEFFGVKSALGHFPREETANVLSDVSIVALSASEFETLFCQNKQIMMKMLRVFSGQLRQIHKKINAILEIQPENQVNGMYNVAKSFYDDEKYRSCCDVCLTLLKRFPNNDMKVQVSELYKNSKLRADMIAKNGMNVASSVPSSDSSNSMFNLPAFERFAKNYEPDQVIISEYEPGNTFYLIQSGEVQLVKYANGAQKKLDILKSGEFFGEMAILDNSPRSATCLAKTKVKCLEFSKENFESLITGNPQIALNLLKLFCKRIYDQKKRFKILTIKDPSVRIANVFLMLYEMNPDSSSDKRTCKLNLTISDIAQWAGLSIEVTRDELNRYSGKRKIEIYDNSIVIQNISDMQRIAETKISF